MLNSWRKKLDKKLTEIQLLQTTEKDCKSELIRLEEELELLKEAREVFKKASLITQNHLAEHLSKIVTKALQAVFYEKEIFFKVKFVERRNTTECDFWLEENGHEFEIMGSRGFGMADIASFALRVAYVLLHSVDNVLIIDEPFRNLDKNKQPFASQMIKELSNELGMQFIISTHVDSLKEYADKSFEIIQKDNISNAY